MNSAVRYRPPPYSSMDQTSQNARLPPSIWLKILTSFIHPTNHPGDATTVLSSYHLHSSIRLVCKQLYLVSMHILRSSHLDRYLSKVKEPFTSDPYPHPSTSSETTTTTANKAQPPPPSYTRFQPDPASLLIQDDLKRETSILDMFISLSIKERMQTFESQLLISDQSQDDLFALLQPQARLEDLLYEMGSVSGTVFSASSSSSYEQEGKIDFKHLSVRFRARTIQLILPMKSSSSASDTSTTTTNWDQPNHHLGEHAGRSRNKVWGGWRKGKGRQEQETTMTTASASSSSLEPERILRKPLIEVERQRSETLESSCRKLIQVLVETRIVRRRRKRAQASDSGQTPPFTRAADESLDEWYEVLA
ncbi:hypothetical protein IE53DRAFT_368986 [Violaceomyces palustris]|uniref:Uncharacterized protein n=1 Tax=Violaceomyces palustris TaxID=1673888 RepID=A0ACD0NWY7_9BASI|nr:hypothetical protein IE53DRAFT_368986 [Violaceomyces palustris]